MFLDEAQVDVKGGDGGKGAVAFRREKYVPRGGPAGGHGGRGGNVILVGDEGLNTLHKFRYTQRYEAERGGHGGGKKQNGAAGEDLRVSVPLGTVVRDEASGEIVGDVVAHGQELVVAQGGRGGRGNTAFTSSTNQAPRTAERGEPGQARRLQLELKLLADVGIIGLPNAGKSTFLAAVSSAKPKVAAYPFTTLQPSLGVADIGYDTLVLADVPGLIEGASEGVGLGDRFLRHVERTRVLLHMLDASDPDPIGAWRTINAELAAFQPALAERPQVVALNKMDLPDARAQAEELRQALSGEGVDDVFSISAATGDGVQEVLRHLARRVSELPAPEAEPESLPVLRPGRVDEKRFTVHQEPDGAWRVSGERVERTAAMTDWENEFAIERFQRQLEAMGVLSVLREHELDRGDKVRIGEHELEWSP